MSWTDYPQYYDLLFRDETPYEAFFIERAFEKYLPEVWNSGKPRRLYEPASGTGRLVAKLAKEGFDVVGCDLAETALAYTRKRLTRQKLHAELHHADMTSFVANPPAHLAYCFVNTFRYLLTDALALQHLAAVADSLCQGGIYLLGFHIIPLDADEECVERWSATHGRTKVDGTLRVTEFDRQRRVEQIRISIEAKIAGSKKEKISFHDDFQFRLYTAGQFRALLAKCPQFELVDVYDFNYDIDEPLPLDDEISDTVAVLRKI